jgi:hypothetical protein
MSNMSRIDEILTVTRKRRDVLLRELDAAIIAKRDVVAVIEHLREALTDNYEIIEACYARLGRKE